jgi:ribonucleoside-diphosphate reductase alpha chain
MQTATASDAVPSGDIPVVEQEKPKEHASAAEAPKQQDLFARAQRRKLPDERKSITHKFSVSGHEGYIIVGMYEDGTPGEIFIKMAKEGSMPSGFMDGLALSISIGLQYGVPLKALVDKLTDTRFEPSGFTENPSMRYASSATGLHCPLAWWQVSFIGISETESRIERPGHDSLSD